MEPVRSAAAQAGYVDVELLMHSAANAFRKATTLDELEEAWASLIKPVEDQLSANAMGILESLFSLNLSIIARCLR
jgi:hypothetical protein